MPLVLCIEATRQRRMRQAMCSLLQSLAFAAPSSEAHCEGHLTQPVAKNEHFRSSACLPTLPALPCHPYLPCFSLYPCPFISSLPLWPPHPVLPPAPCCLFNLPSLSSIPFFFCLFAFCFHFQPVLTHPRLPFFIPSVCVPTFLPSLSLCCLLVGDANLAASGVYSQ